MYYFIEKKRYFSYANRKLFVMGKEISLYFLSEGMSVYLDEMKHNKRKICFDRSDLKSFNGGKRKKSQFEGENKSII